MRTQSFIHDLQEHAAASNVGAVDCLARIMLGLLLIALALGGTIGHWGYAGFFPLVTGAAWVCPFYTLFGVSTQDN